MIELYGTAMSRAFRCLWVLEELGLEYRHVPVHFRNESKKPEYLALNPNGRVPCLKDGELVLFESLAINLYLCRKYGPDLMPAGGVEDEGRLLQWTLWATNELDFAPQRNQPAARPSSTRGENPERSRCRGGRSRDADARPGRRLVESRIPGR